MTIPIRPTLILLALLPWGGVIAGPLETITVTGVSAQKEDAGTLDVVTLERRQIEQLHKESLADLLRTIPGVLVNVQGGVGGNTDISIRGAEPNFVTLYIDGIRVNDPVNARGSAFNFNSVNVKAIERIEVVRGPASTLYGSGAIAGVIRITTAADTPSQSLATDIDQDGNYRYGYRLADSTGPWEYSFGLAQNDFLNDKNRNRYDSSEATLGLAYRYSGKGLLYTKFRAMEDEQESYPEQSGGVESAAMDKLDDTNSSERMGSIGWNHTVTPIWESSLQASYFHRNGSQASPGIVPFTQVPPNRERINYSDTSLRWNNRVSLLPHLQLQAGFDANRERGESHGVIDVGFPMPVSYRHERDSHGVVLGLDWTSENGWLLQGAIRNDKPDGHHSQVTRQAGFVSPAFAEILSISANWGEGFKLPGFSALAHPLVGNPLLKPETSESSEITLQIRANKATTLSLTGFSNEFRNLIDFDPILFKNVNRAKVRTSGGEISIASTPVESLAVNLYTTYTDFSVVEGDADFTGRPKVVAGILANWLITEKWQATTDYQWSDSRMAGTLHRGSAELVELSSRQLAHFSVRWQAQPRLALALAIDNLFDKAYEEAVGQPSPGRTFRLEMTYGK